MGCSCNSNQEEKKPILTEEEHMIPEVYHYDIRKKYSFMRIVNHGAFGQVKLYQDKIYKQALFAIKTIPKENLTPKMLTNLKNEIEILSQLDHPNIVNYYCTIETYSNFNILMEYVSEKSLHYLLLKEREKVTIEEYRLIIYQILSALCYIHNKGIVHRDIKPENILLYENFGLKIIDFGLGVFKNKSNDVVLAGTPSYMSPEAFEGTIQRRIDIWSVGIIYYLYCFGRYPFQTDSEKELYYKIKNEEIDYETGRLNNVTDDDIDLMKKMLEVNYDKRITANSAIRHDVFGSINHHFFVNDSIDRYVDEFFSIKTVKLMEKYVKSSIIKKLFVYMYIWLSSFKKRSYYKKMFVAIDNYYNYSGYLKSREVFEEFKGRGIVNEENGKVFSFLDLNHSNKAKDLYKKEDYMIEKSTNGEGMKGLHRSASSKSLKYKDWGIISYSTFLSIFYIDEIYELKDNDEIFKYLFSYFCDRPLCDNPKNEIIDIKGNIKPGPKLVYDFPDSMTKATFMRFCYKHNLPIKDTEDDINKFFDIHPHPIFYDEFKNLILNDDENNNYYDINNEIINNIINLNNDNGNDNQIENEDGFESEIEIINYE